MAIKDTNHEEVSMNWVVHVSGGKCLGGLKVGDKLCKRTGKWVGQILKWTVKWGEGEALGDDSKVQTSLQD